MFILKAIRPTFFAPKVPLVCFFCFDSDEDVSTIFPATSKCVDTHAYGRRKAVFFTDGKATHFGSGGLNLLDRWRQKLGLKAIGDPNPVHLDPGERHAVEWPE